MKRDDIRSSYRGLFQWTVLIVSAGLASSAMALEMRAGVAKAVITNTEPLVMVNGNTSAGTANDIHARVLTLNDGDGRLIIVTYDLNCLDVATAILRERVQKELGIGPERLILLATHNHNAPIQIVPDNFAYGRGLADTIFGLIQEAMDKEVGPVQVLFGSGPGYFVISRGNAPTDYEIQILEVMHKNKPLALLFNHGTHPAQASETEIDAGHPGFAMAAIEKALPGVQAMYADASGGNQFVRRPATLNKELSKARRQGKEAVAVILDAYARKLGDELAAATLAITEGELTDVTGPITSTMEILSLPLAPPVSREEAKRLADKAPMNVGFVPYPDRNRGTNWVRMLNYWYERGLPFPKTTTELVCTDDTYLVHKTDKNHLKKYRYSLNEAFPCVYEEVIVARIGPMPFVAMQGEVCGPIGMRIKDEFRWDMPIFVTAYMGEHNLYIPTRELVRIKAYQSRVIQIQYASPVGWAPEVEDEMVDGVIAMVNAALGN